jgi:hypothetical protein
MKQLSIRERSIIKKKMAKALNDEIKPLPVEMQNILLDDMVTAFESRLAVLIPEDSNTIYFIEEKVKVLNQSF